MTISPVNFFENNPSYERQARPVNFFANPKVIPPYYGGESVEAGIAAINGEISPQYLATATSGETYTNGIGASSFTFNALG